MADTDTHSLLAQVGAATSTTLPPPGSGRTLERWHAFVRLGATDLAVAKLAEPHHDAAAVLADLGLSPPAPGSLWAVWAAEPPFAKVTADRGARGWSLTGTKAFCSGALFVSDALVSADGPDGARIFAVDLAAGRSDGRIVVDDPSWTGAGMRAADTRTLQLTDVPATEVGGPRAYLDRPGFWHGAMGIAACWLGAADAVAAPLRKAGHAGRLDPHGLAHLGAVTATLDASHALLERTASSVDADPEDVEGRSRRDALALRATVTDSAENVIRRVGRALGPGPLAFDADHARRVADLEVFVRQDHAERDLAALGALVAGADDGK